MVGGEERKEEREGERKQKEIGLEYGKFQKNVHL